MEYQKERAVMVTKSTCRVMRVERYHPVSGGEEKAGEMANQVQGRASSALGNAQNRLSNATKNVEGRVANATNNSTDYPLSTIRETEEREKNRIYPTKRNCMNSEQ